MQTKVILKKDVYGLGEEGDIKNVKAGYARNYLIPFSYAVVYNKYTLMKLEEEHEEIAKRKEIKGEKSKSLYDKLDGLELIFEENVGEKGKLFGSVNKNDIHQRLSEHEIVVEKRAIQLNTPIREIGTREVLVELYGEMLAKLKVIIRNKEESVKEESVKEESVKEESVKEESVKEVVEDKESLKEESEKEESEKEESEKEEKVNMEGKVEDVKEVEEAKEADIEKKEEGVEEVREETN